MARRAAWWAALACSLVVTGCGVAEPSAGESTPSAGGDATPAVPDACTVATTEELAATARLPEVVVTARSVDVDAPAEDLCGFGAPTSIGTYAVAVALRTGVTVDAFRAERNAAGTPPRFSQVRLPPDARAVPIPGLGRAAWSRTTYVVEDDEASPSGVEVQVLEGTVVLRVVTSEPATADPDVAPAVALARSAVQRLPPNLSIGKLLAGEPCMQVSGRVLAAALGAGVVASRSVVHDDGGDLQCWWDAGPAFLEVVVRHGDEALAVGEAALTAPGTRPLDLGDPDLRAAYTISPHQDGVLVAGDVVITLRGLTAREAGGSVPREAVATPTAADRALLLELARVFGT